MNSLQTLLSSAEAMFQHHALLACMLGVAGCSSVEPCSPWPSPALVDASAPPGARGRVALGDLPAADATIVGLYFAD